MAIALDAISPGGTAGYSATNSVTWTHTASATSTIIIACSITPGNSNNSFTPSGNAVSCTVDGTSAILIGSINAGSTSANAGYVALFKGSVAPGSHTVILSTPSDSHILYTAATFIGVQSVGTGSTSQGVEANAPSLTVATSSGHLTVAAGTYGTSITSPSPSVLSILNHDGTSAAGNLALLDGTTGNFSFANASDWFGFVGADLTPSSGGATQWGAVGTVSAVSGVSGNPTVSSTSGTTSGNLAVPVSLVGQASKIAIEIAELDFFAGLSGATSIGSNVVWQAAGTVAGISTVAGTELAKLRVSGSVSGISSISGTLTPLHSYIASGNVTGISGVSGSVTNKPVFAGIVTGITSVSGSVQLKAQSNAIIAAISSVNGAITQKQVVSGQVAGHSIVTGVSLPPGSIGGIVNAASAVTGNAVGQHTIQSVVAATSLVAGNITSLRPINGSVAGSANDSGAVIKLGPLVGTNSAISGATGSAAARAVTASLIVAGISTVVGSAIPLHFQVGTVSSTTTVSGAVDGLLSINGAIQAVSDSSSDATAFYLIDGAISVVSNAIGNILNYFPSGQTGNTIVIEPGNYNGSPIIVINQQFTNNYPDTKSYMAYTQSDPALVWNIEHDFGRLPVVEVLDNDGNVIQPQSMNVNLLTVTINFSTPTSGQAVLATIGKPYTDSSSVVVDPSSVDTEPDGTIIIRTN